MKQKSFLLGFLLPLLLTALLSWYEDPFGIFGYQPIYTGTDQRMRIALAYEIKRIKPKILIMGTSRVRNFPKTHPDWTNETVLNANLPNGTIYEYRNYLEHAQAAEPLEQIIVELGYPSFIFDVPTQFTPDRLYHLTQPINRFTYFRTITEDFYGAIFSLRSVELVAIDLLGIAHENEVRYLSFIESIKTLLHFNADSSPPQQQTSALDDLAAILRIAQTNNIQAFFFIPPMHATEEEYLVSTHGFESIETWKRNLVSVFQKESERSRVGFPLWDFSDYNSITTETIPPDKQFKEMRYFNDSRHFKLNVSKMILDRMFSTCEIPCTIPEDFGVAITQYNIEQHLNQTRQKREQYLRLKSK